MKQTESTDAIDRMFAAGVHYGVTKSRRHPSAAPLLFTQKQGVDLFDLEKTLPYFERAQEFMRALGADRKTVLFLGGKPESQRVVKQTAERLGSLYVVGRWIGGMLTNFSEIKKRIARLVDLTRDRESGALQKYTKLERLMMDREIERLESKYGGMTTAADKLPDALVIIDPKREAIAIREARAMRIPVVALANSDCDMSMVEYPVPGNDAAVRSISYFVDFVAHAYEEGTLTKRVAPAAAPRDAVEAV